ncbi:hypothetical protein [Peptostreptococcus canis]|uniref:DUF948 domain-containing protein n=1 Tax=Peptostreptococcus canis TaxID=1159213 RepID=A0ABR6TLF2_9FIRM|nr:hypothetical protein [Peptostreptococcus canis]MBC2576024.1 hypothetical protein [Peptostreptococcus canis]MBP1997852.1 methyl-accepting chemotaxis protein [Peptostreptococcus canis]
MTITIDIQTILFILAILGCVVLIFLIIFLKKLSNLISRIDDLINQNSTNVGLTIAKLPSLISGVDSVVDNAKDVSDVAVDFASDALVAKEKIKSGISTSVNIAGIVKDVFKK